MSSDLRERLGMIVAELLEANTIATGAIMEVLVCGRPDLARMIVDGMFVAGLGARRGMEAAISALVEAETAELVEQLLLVREGRLPCGHRRTELVAGAGVITHCRCCRAEGRTL